MLQYIDFPVGDHGQVSQTCNFVDFRKCKRTVLMNCNFAHIVAAATAAAVHYDTATS